MATSGTYEFGSPQNEQLITDAYERCSVAPSLVVAEKVTTALRSLNFILQSWPNRGLNLWSVRQGMIGINANQTSYALPDHGIRIKTACIRTSTRNLGGTAASSAGGVADNAFDNNPATACVQNAPNGNISYTWGAAQYPISMVGIMSNPTLTYKLEAEYSYDGATWSSAASIPSQSYTGRQVFWFAINMPVPANYFRIRETGGETLDISELYFSTNINDTQVTEVSESEYTTYSNKNIAGRPSCFYQSRLINPIVFLYPTPNSLYNNLYYTYIKQLQDIGAMVDTAEVPARFLEALTAELAFRLAVKEGLFDRTDLLKSLAQEEYKLAGEEDRETVPLRIFGSYMQGWTR